LYFFKIYAIVTAPTGIRSYPDLDGERRGPMGDKSPKNKEKRKKKQIDKKEQKKAKTGTVSSIK
jgi:hypothetical protein